MFNLLRKNFKAIIASILLASSLWLLVKTENRYSYTIRVPVRITRLAEGKTIANPIPTKVSIEVEGKGRSLLALYFYDVGFNLELTDVKSERRIELDKFLNFLDLPKTFDITVKNILEPKYFDLKVDDLVHISKRIQFAGSITPADGYVLITHHFNRDSVMLDGPKSLVKALEYVQTESLRVTGQKNDFQYTLKLNEPAPGLITMEPKQVRASFDIQRLVERIVYDIPVKVIDYPANLFVEAVPPFLALRIKGGEKIVAGVKAEDIHVQINFNRNFRPDKEEYSALITTPGAISWTESIPRTFKLKVKRK
jgi:YbbR domain-containing protein